MLGTWAPDTLTLGYYPILCYTLRYYTILWYSILSYSWHLNLGGSGHSVTWHLAILLSNTACGTQCLLSFAVMCYDIFYFAMTACLCPCRPIL